MNQKIIISGFLTLALISTGCAAQTSSQTKTDSELTTARGASTASSSDGTASNSESTAVKETNRSTIGKFGKVKKIIGNSVTIELAEIPKRTERAAATKDGTKTTSTTSDAAKEGGMPPSGEPPTGGGTTHTGSGGSSGGTGGSPNGTGWIGGSSGKKGSFGLNTEKLNLTGEVVELMIPVGVKITSTGTGGMKEIDFADIAQGDTIALYYIQGTETIERVVITPSSTN